MDQVESPIRPATRASPVRIKKLGHIVLQVRDVERSIQFYTEVLNFRVSDRQETGGAFLTGIGDHHTIGLFPSAGASAQTPADDAVKLNHFALQVGSIEELFDIRAYLQERGVKINFQGRRRLGGHTSVEFLDPDGFHVELYCDMDQLGPQQSARPMGAGPRIESLEAARDNPKPPTW